MKNMKVIHGHIGCGRVARNHIDGFLCAGAEIRWICDLIERKAKNLARFCPNARITTDYREILNDPDVHSVSIAVDHEHHFQIACDALLADKHVLLEKPIALKIEEAEELVRIANKRKKILAVVSQHRFDPLVRNVKRIIDMGGIGDISSISCTLVATRNADYYTQSYWRGSLKGEGGSALINQGYHLIDLMVWMGGKVKEVSGAWATKKLRGVIETEETFCGILKYHNDALGTLNVTLTGQQMWNTRILVVGTEGNIEFDINMPNKIYSMNLKSNIKNIVSVPKVRHTVIHPPGIPYYSVSHRQQITEFVNCIVTGRSVSVNGNEAKKTLEVILALYESAKTQSFKYLPYRGDSYGKRGTSCEWGETCY